NPYGRGANDRTTQRPQSAGHRNDHRGAFCGNAARRLGRRDPEDRNAGTEDALWVKILIGISIPSVVYVRGPAVLSEITPASQRGAILSINNATITPAGLLGPYLTGSAIQDAATQAEGYVHGFFICGVITLISDGLHSARGGDPRRSRN